MFEIKGFFDERSFTVTYVVFDPATRDAVIIDPVLDYDPGASRTWTESLDAVVAFVTERGLVVRGLLETHAHADHLSGAQLLKQRFPAAKTAIGAGICAVQQLFKGIFDLPEDFPVDGRQFDRLLGDGERFVAGSLELETIATPGHTPACVTFRIGDALFTGDLMFMPDQGTGRCDFPGGSAREMYRSITERLYTLPDETRVFVGHDYQPGGRALAFETTIGQQKAENVQLPASLDEDGFVARREARDAQLAAPKLLFQSIQVNIDAGALPAPAGNEVRYLRIPINVFKPSVGPTPAVELRELPKSK